jgi:hypothetical protein|tara:strand:+ start:578 stop:928 length:351 start_codon:yes stop_codon:yes gene_type:complete
MFREIAMFKDFYEMVEVVLILCNDFSPKEIKEVGRAINVCHTLNNDKDKRYRLYQSIEGMLWNNSEAINIGFRPFLRKKRKEVNEMLKYHELNCKGIGCQVCIDRKKVYDIMKTEM